ncbi:iron ABC transporter permease (plasmid) [Corynebacterium diphtheriae]|nr:iron ABC transporter permease [Corynebacterium diphtheriae]QVJ00021.1 iron ABC transporter permease [Corynebacterium diphtheriae]
MAATALRSPRTRVATVFFILLALTLVATVFSLMFGVRSITVAEALSALRGATDTAGEAAAWTRIPRTVLALCAGATLATSGVVFQAVTRNPLADPGIFGVLSGASLAVVISIAFFNVTRPFPTMIIAATGAFAAAAFVYSVGSIGRGGATPLKLALAGAATAAALSSLTSAILLPRAEVMDAFRNWQIGSVGGARWDSLSVALSMLGIGFIIVFLSCNGLNALALGDDVATGLGINLTRTRVLATLGAVLLCGTVTAVTGPIAFVGLIVPHLIRMVLGTDHRILLPANALAGAVLLTLADTAGRLLHNPSEVAVGIIMPFLGAPLFIWIVRQTRIREL